MSQHDFTIDNQTAALARADINNALRALASLSSGNTAPATTFQNQFWYEDDTNTLWIRNEANSAWVKLITFDYTNSRNVFFVGRVQVLESAGAIEIRRSDGNILLKIENDGDVSGSVIASQTQAEGGTDNESLMTPLRTKQAIDEHASGFKRLRDFSTTSEGYREIAWTWGSAGCGQSFNLDAGVDITDYEFIMISSVGPGNQLLRKTEIIEVASLLDITLQADGKMDFDTYQDNYAALRHVDLPVGGYDYLICRSGTNTLWLNAGGSNIVNYIRLRRVYGG